MVSYQRGVFVVCSMITDDAIASIRGIGNSKFQLNYDIQK